VDTRITVLHFCEHFGGAEASLHGVARGFQWWIPAFDSTRFRVLLCSRKGRDKAAEQMEQSGIQPIYLGYGKMDPRNLVHLVKLVRRERIDIIHAHGYGACTWGRIAGLVLGIPVIVHERCNTVTVPLYQRPVEWLLGRTTTLALAVSESSRRFCIEKRYMKPEAVKVLYHGILMDDIRRVDDRWKQACRTERGVGATQKVIGVVGRLESHKGHIDAFTALKTVLQTMPDVKLWVVGDGAYRETLQDWVRDNDLAGSVDFLGFRRDVRDLIQCFDVHLFPSHMEGTPNTLYEALAVGNACVASTADGQGEILTDGETALLFEPGDSRKMAGQLLRVLGDKAVELALREHAQALAARFDGRAAIRTMEQYYVKLLAGS
jgi:glycosyltransferase involved in cell wall biosynthesis